MRLKSLIGCACIVLTFVQANAAQFTLHWEHVTTPTGGQAQGFEIERAPGLNATTGFQLIGVATGADKRTYVDAGLPNGAAFSYRVCAYNTAGRSGFSNTASDTTPEALPDAPSLTPLESPPDYAPGVPVVSLPVGQSLLIVGTP